MLGCVIGAVVLFLTLSVCIQSCLHVERLGELQRSRPNRVLGLRCTGDMLVCYSKHQQVDVFRVLNEQQIEERVSKRIKKAKKRLREENKKGYVNYFCYYLIYHFLKINDNYLNNFVHGKAFMNGLHYCGLCND